MLLLLLFAGEVVQELLLPCGSYLGGFRYVFVGNSVLGSYESFIVRLVPRRAFGLLEVWPAVNLGGSFNGNGDAALTRHSRPRLN